MFEIIKTLLRRNPEKKKSNYTFDDTDREKATLKKLSIQVQKQRQEILLSRLNHLKEIQEQRQIEQEIAYLEEDVFNQEEDTKEEESPRSMESSLIDLFMKVLTPKQNPVSVPDVQTEFNPQDIVNSMTKEQRESLKKLSPSKIHELAKMYYPDLSPLSIDMIIPLL